MTKTGCLVLSQFEFSSFVTIWVFEFCHNLSFELSQFSFLVFYNLIFWILSFLKILCLVSVSVFEFCHNSSFWVLSQLEFEFCHSLSFFFFTIWVFKFCHNLFLPPQHLDKRPTLRAAFRNSCGVFPCSKPICVPPGSPKTYFVFSHNSMYHMFSKLFDSQDLTSHLNFVKSCVPVSSCFYSQNKSRICQNTRKLPETHQAFARNLAESSHKVAKKLAERDTRFYTWFVQGCFFGNA